MALYAKGAAGVSGIIYISTLKLDDTNASNYLTIDWNENDTVDRSLTLKVGGADREITLSGNPTLADWFDQSVKAAANVAFKTVVFGAIYSNSNSGDAITISWNNGQKQSIVLTGAPCVFTFTAPTSGTGNFLLKCTQGAGGSKTATWPATVKWPSGTAPTLSTAAAAVDIVSFFYDGTNYYGSSSLNFS